MARYSAQGTTFWFEVTGGSPVAQISGIQDLNINEQPNAEVDATGLDDTSSVTLAGLPQSSTVTVTIFYDPNITAHETVRGLRGTNTVRSFEIRMPTTPAKKFTASGVINSAVPQFGRGNAMTLAVEIKLTTALTLV